MHGKRIDLEVGQLLRPRLREDTGEKCSAAGGLLCEKVPLPTTSRLASCLRVLGSSETLLARRGCKTRSSRSLVEMEYHGG